MVCRLIIVKAMKYWPKSILYWYLNSDSKKKSHEEIIIGNYLLLLKYVRLQASTMSNSVDVRNLQK